VAHIVTGRDGRPQVVKGATTGDLDLVDFSRQHDIYRLAVMGEPQARRWWDDFQRQSPADARLVKEYDAAHRTERQSAVRRVDSVLTKAELPEPRDYGDRFQDGQGNAVPEPDWHREKRARKIEKRERKKAWRRELGAYAASLLPADPDHEDEAHRMASAREYMWSPAGRELVHLTENSRDPCERVTAAKSYAAGILDAYGADDAQAGALATLMQRPGRIEALTATLRASLASPDPAERLAAERALSDLGEEPYPARWP
jgi:hypothetical protein